tara:strand:- start:234 stop:428 length:195 start_codon:yes stop_codon:yes gene_type:complete
MPSEKDEERAFTEIMLATIDNSHESDEDIASIINERAGFVSDSFDRNEILTEIKRQKERMKYKG